MEIGWSAGCMASSTISHLPDIQTSTSLFILLSVTFLNTSKWVGLLTPSYRRLTYAAETHGIQASAAFGPGNEFGGKSCDM